MHILFTCNIMTNRNKLNKTLNCSTLSSLILTIFLIRLCYNKIKFHVGHYRVDDKPHTLAATIRVKNPLHITKIFRMFPILILIDPKKLSPVQTNVTNFNQNQVGKFIVVHMALLYPYTLLNR